MPSEVPGGPADGPATHPNLPRRGALVREFRTPFDGKVSIGPAGDPELGYELLIRDGSGDQEVGGSPCFGHGPANNSSSD